MTNQSEEILNYIKENPGASVEDIVRGTGWNRHLVEVAVKLMVEQGLVKETGQTDWLDFRYEIDQGYIHHSKATGTLPLIERNLERLEKDGFGASPLQRAASALSGLAAGIKFPHLSLLVDAGIEHERSLVEIAALANLTTAEVVDFYQTHPYSLEFIKAAIQAGAKLDKEDIKRTMEERARYTFTQGIDSKLAEIIRTSAFEVEQHTFIVTLPNNDRREVKAHYMEVDGGSLYFEDDSRETILAFGPGHWVWAERVEENE